MKSIIEMMQFVSFCLSLTRKGREGRKERERETKRVIKVGSLKFV